MNEDHPLTPATIVSIAWDIRDGTATPSDAQRLLKHFCRCVKDRESIPEPLIEFLDRAFREFLSGDKTLERALGLARREGRPKADPHLRSSMATEILRLRLAGTPHQTAVDEVSEHFGWGKTIVGEAWKDNRPNALLLLRLERALDNYPWSRAEIARLGEIFGDEPWFVRWGESAKQKMDAFLRSIDNPAPENSPTKPA